MPERPLPYRPPEVEDFEKPSRVGRGRRHERKPQERGEPVSGRAVHRRGQVVEAVSEQTSETKEIKRLKELRVLIADRYERCSRLVGFIEANNYELPENFSETLIQDFYEGSDIARRYLSDSGKVLTENQNFLSDMVKIEGLMKDFETRLTRLQTTISALERGEGLEKSGDRIVVPDEIKALFEQPASTVENPSNDEEAASEGNEGSGRGPEREGGSFEERIDTVELKMNEYAALRKELIARIGTKEYENFIQASGEVGELARGSVLKMVEQMLVRYRETFRAGEAPPKREWDELDHHIEGFDRILALTRAKIDSQPAPQGEQREEQVDTFPGEQLDRAKAFLQRWDELCTDFGKKKVLAALEKKHPGYEIPHVESMRGWIEKHAAPENWKNRWAKRNHEQLLVNLETLEGMIADAEEFATSVREGRRSEEREKQREAEFIEFLRNHQRGILEKLRAVRSERELEALLAEQTGPIDANFVLDDTFRGYLKGRSISDEATVQRVFDQSKSLNDEVIAEYRALRERLASESKNDAEFSEKLTTAKDLVQRWDVLGAEFGFKELKEEIKTDGQGGIPYTKSVQDWFEGKKEEVDWKGADRRDLIDRMIPDMEGLLVRAEAAATRLRAEAAARANVTVLATGRKIETDEQMIPWEKADPPKREAFIRELSTKEKDGYRRALAQKLTQMGITDRLKRDQFGKQAFEDFMPARIQQLAKQSQFELTVEEVETLMVNLRKEFLVP